MKALHFTASLLALLPAIGCVLPGADDDDDDSAGDTHGESGTATSPSTSPSTTATSDDDGSSSDDSDGGSGSVDSSDGGEQDSTGEHPATSCENATLLLGNPYFDGELGDSNPEGQGMLDDPPLRSRHLADVGGKLAIETQSEIWVADAGQIHRVAGDEHELEPQYQPTGACADVRLLVVNGIAGLPGNRLAIADTRGGAIVELTDPFGDCTATAIAGTQDQVFDFDIFGGSANPGDTDGPGAQAQFEGVMLPVADDAGNIYVLDAGNADFKRIADDADRTVTTLFHFVGDEVPLAMTVLDGTLYVTGSNATNDWLWSIDTEDGTQAVVYEGRGLLEELDSSQQLSMFGLDNDGTDLLVASNKGYLFRMSTAAEPLGVIAGFGPIVDFPTDLDLTMPIPVGELPIHSYGINDASLLRLGDDILFTNDANGVGYHVWAVSCE